MRVTTAAERYVADRVARGEIVYDTARNIRCSLAHFAELLGDPPLEYLTSRSMGIFIEHMHRFGVARGTQNRQVSAVRCFAQWCVLNELVARDWTLAAPKVTATPRRMRRDMTDEHFERILGQATNQRDRLIVWLMFGCGLRCVEVSRLDVDDYDDTSRFVFVVGKGGHQGFAAVPPPVRDALFAYLADGGHSDGPLVRRHGSDERLSKSGISTIVARLVARAGLKVASFDGRSAHGLRAAGAQAVYRVSKDLDLVKEFLRHANYATLHIYTQRERLDELRAVVDRRFDAA